MLFGDYVDVGEISFIVLIRISACGKGEKGSNMTTLWSIILPALTSLCVSAALPSLLSLSLSMLCVFASIYVYEHVKDKINIRSAIPQSKAPLGENLYFALSLFTSSLY